MDIIHGLEIETTEGEPFGSPASLAAYNAAGPAMKDSPAVAVALAHIDAWSRHDWAKTKELLAPDVHATVTTTQPNFVDAELTGIDNYMEPKKRAARLVEPGSVQVLSAIGDERSALVTVTFEIGLGQGATMVTMARSCLYRIDDDRKIKEERDSFFLLSR
jgi:hypothetical protein